MGEANKDPETTREGSVSSIDSETAFTEWMEARPRPEVKVPDDVLLFETIKLRKEPSLRETLTKICQNIPEARDLAIKELLMYKDETLPEDELECMDDVPFHDYEADGNGKSSEDFEGGLEEIVWRRHNAAVNNPWWKQKCEKYATCKRCGEEYQQIDWPWEDCNYHPGKRIVDKESSLWNFESWDSAAYGWDWLESQSPKFTKEVGWDIGFKWDCCGKSVAAYGEFCKKGTHIPIEGLLVKNLSEGPSTPGAKKSAKHRTREEIVEKMREQVLSKQLAEQKLAEQQLATQKLAESGLPNNQRISAWDGLVIERRVSGQGSKQPDGQQSDEAERGPERASGKRPRGPEDDTRNNRPRLV